MRFLNTYTNKKEEFIPLEPGKVKIYSCGVTVYDVCHLGHAMQAMIYDMFRNYLEYRGFDVTYIRNYTDVDDKIINRAAELGITPLELSRQMIEETDHDLELLDIKPATFQPKVSDHISDIVAFVSVLVEKKYAYVTDKGDVYFSVRKFKNYGGLSNRNIEELRSGARIEPDEAKEDALDFILWKREETEGVSWDSPWGKGRPGWHIECSVLAMKFLGERIDIHGGGLDLIFPHHENEIAQSEAGTGKKFASYWIHNGLLSVEGQKMSKSLGNYLTVRDGVRKFHPQVIRFNIFTFHYSSNINFSKESFAEGYIRLNYFYTTLKKIDDLVESTPEFEDKLRDETMVNQIIPDFTTAMDDDLNTPVAIANLSNVMKYANDLLASKKIKVRKKVFTLKSIAESIREIGAVLGLFILPPGQFLKEVREIFIRECNLDAAEIQTQIEKRNAARKNRNWQEADAIRDCLEERGIKLVDKPEGTDWGIDFKKLMGELFQ